MRLTKRMKKIYKILITTLVCLSVFLINIPVFADVTADFDISSDKDHTDSTGGFGVADGQLITIDYVKQNPSLFADFDIKNDFENNDILKNEFDAFAELNYNSNNVSSLLSLAHESWWRFAGGTGKHFGAPNSSKFIYFVGNYSCNINAKNRFYIIFTEKPLVLKDNCLYDLGKNTGQVYWEIDNEKSLYASLGGGNSVTLGGQPAWRLFDNSSFANGKSETVSVVYPLPNNKIMPITDGGGNTFVGTGDFDNVEKGYRIQKQLEQYSKYDPDNYPKASPLKRKNNWIKTPDIAYHDDNIMKKGGNKAFKGFYFNKISSPNGPTINILENGRYTYHLYLYKNEKWKPVTIWSSTVLTFKNSRDYTSGYVKPPTLSTQQKTYAIMLDYETNTLISINDDNAFVSGAISNNTPYVISQDNYYIVNDDIAVLADNSSENRGSDVVNEKDNHIIDTEGNDKGEGKDVGGTYYPPDRFEPLPKPSSNASIFEWINYFIDNIDKIFDTIGEGIKSIGDNVTSFFGLIGSFFSFLPSEVWTILTLGLAIIIILRIFGR